jgi:hypothetical protein
MFLFIIILVSIQCEHDCLEKIVDFTQFDQACQSGNKRSLPLQQMKQLTVMLKIKKKLDGFDRGITSLSLLSFRVVVL